MAISKGTIITCPECHKKLFKAKRDILKGEAVYAGDFSAIEQEPINCAMMVCCSCNTPYFNIGTGQIHTENGWT